jgi:hypothetical protein
LKDSEFCWLDNHDNALDEIKRLVTAKPVLKYYDPKLQLVTNPMILLTPETLVGFGISSMARTFSGSGLRPLLVIKCPINLMNGFWHVELDDESSYLTTFNTPFGRYRWLWMPFGISSAPEEYQRRQDQTVEGLPGVRSIIDDILIYGEGDGVSNVVK